MQQRIGKYEVVERVGKGAMGEVFKANDTVLNRPVAIKIISSNLVSDEQFRRRFLQEARSAAQLNHRNIVTVYEFNEDPAQVYMVMEFLEGTDLREAIKDRSLRSVSDKLQVMEQVCDGLAYAHAKSIIHRDLKPANIRLLPNLTPKIMDFGLARLGTSEITRAGTVMGTPDYMSPEQVRAESVDARSDIFSLGAVLYHLLTGRKPFEKESVHSILYEVLERDPPPLRDVAPELPPLVVPLVEKALQKQPARRYASAGEFRAALRDARRAIAASRAAAAALIPGVEGEATITRFDAPTPSYPSLPSAVGSRHGGSRPGTAASLAGTSGSLGGRSAPAPASAASPPTIALRSGSLIEGATVLQPAADAETPTERPAETIVGSVHDPSLYEAPPAASGARLLLVGGLGLFLLAGAGFATWKVLDTRATEAARLQQEQIQALVLLNRETQLDLARSELVGKNYSAALQQAEAILAEDPDNAEAGRIAVDARGRLGEVEAAAREARQAVARGDTATADGALSRVLAIDPRHPVVAELSQALNQQFRARTEAAKTQAEAARRAAEAAQGASQPSFSAAEGGLRAAEARLAAGQFVEATRGFSEARDLYDRARREAETARAAQARAAEVAKLQAAIKPSARPPQPPPPTSAAAPLPTLAVNPAVAAPASTPLPGAAPPPPAAVVPSLPGAPASPGVATGGAEAAVRRTLGDYARALETRDLTLFKAVMPGLTADQEKNLRESFKAVKSQQVSLTVESVQVTNDKAVVRVARQDTVDGKAQKARQQTFRLSQRGGAWAIDSIGQ